MGGQTSQVYLSIRNLPSLTRLYLTFDGIIDDHIVRELFHQCPNIKELYLEGIISYFNLDDFINLRQLSLSGFIDEKFNFELFKNLSKQLEDLTIGFANIDEQTYFKMFDGYKFPNLVDFTLGRFNMKRVKKEFINRFPELRRLKISDCNIEVIERDSFSHLKKLCWLILRRNRIEFIEKKAFSKLKNLQKLDLTDSGLANFDPKFVCLRKSVEVSL